MSTSPNPETVILLTLHRAGSKIANRVVATLAAAGCMPQVDLAGEAWRAGASLDSLLRDHRGQIPSHGSYYGPLRTPHFLQLGDLSGFRAVIHIRDPRDCLVSAYFSWVASHPVPPPGLERQKFLERRRGIKAMTIDEFCVGKLPLFVPAFVALQRAYETLPKSHLSKYEEMVVDTENWLRRLADFLDQPLTEDLMLRLKPLLNFSINKEQPAQDKRQVTPGDHLRKLQPETIEQLTHALLEPLLVFDYPRPGGSA